MKKTCPEQAYRSCMGILSFAKRKGSQTLQPVNAPTTLEDTASQL